MDPVLLSSRAAGRCARRVHNEFDRTLPRVEQPVSATARLRLDAGRDREQAAIAALTDALGADRVVDLRDHPEPLAATRTALDAGADVVVGGRLPDDRAGARSGARRGSPGLLLRARGGYVPGEVKGHLITRPHESGEVLWSTLAAPMRATVVPRRELRTRYREDDFLQLAHAWRLLEACGRAAPGRARGCVLGTDSLPGADTGPGPGLAWLALDDPVFTTYSRSSPTHTRRRSALERYDHEHGFRVRVAATARRRVGAADDPDPLVRPVFVTECDTCPWLESCLEVLGDDASTAVTVGRLGVRERLSLAGVGVRTRDDLADLDVDADPRVADYLAEVPHLSQAESRLRTAARRARMARDGVDLERLTTGPIELPRRAVEVDLDLENDPAGRVYLWGALVDGRYRHFSSFAPLDAEGERALARALADWLRTLVAEHGGDVAVYHYAPVEDVRLREILGDDEVADLLPHFVDLWPVVRDHYLGRAGLGLKQVAPAFGFRWRDEDPGGLQSQVWLQTAATDPRMRQRVLDYNEDDVRATAVVREGLRRGWVGSSGG